MPILTVRTKFNFGDLVTFDSPTQGCSGSGEIIGVTIDGRGEIDYMIGLEGTCEGRAGILEEEITLSKTALPG